VYDIPKNASVVLWAEKVEKDFFDEDNRMIKEI
jgi:hypothetical protein